MHIIGYKILNQQIYDNDNFFLSFVLLLLLAKFKIYKIVSLLILYIM